MMGSSQSSARLREILEDKCDELSISYTGGDSNADLCAKYNTYINS